MSVEKLSGKAESVNDNGVIPSADVVAISMALHLFYDEVHDTESNVITIKRIERRYSPWSSKIYGVTNNLR
jgi:glutaconyl-CoA/methylmalonyl-CoA decarboxylase subunit delta